MKVTFYGSSDDNLCVEGDVNDEWSAYSRARSVHTDTGLVVQGEYSPDGYDGMWKVRVVGDVPDGHIVTFEKANGPDDDYSDQVTVEGPFSRVLPYLDREELIDAMSDFNWKNLDTGKLFEIAKAMGLT